MINDAINLVSPLKTFSTRRDKSLQDEMRIIEQYRTSRSRSRSRKYTPKDTYIHDCIVTAIVFHISHCQNRTRSWSKRRGRSDEYGMMIVVGLVCMYDRSRHEKQITGRTRHSRREKFNAGISKIEYRSLRVWIKMLTRTISPKQAYQTGKSGTKTGIECNNLDRKKEQLPPNHRIL